METYNKHVGIVDMETGELEAEYKDGVKTNKVKSKKEKARDKARMEKRDLEETLFSANGFVVTQTIVDFKLASVLRKSEYILFKALIQYLPYNSGVLMRKDYVTEYATLDYFVEDIKDFDGNAMYSKQVLKNLMTELKKHDLIASFKTTDSGLFYMVNPWVAFRGKQGVHEYVVNTFKDSRWKEVFLESIK